MTIPKRTDDEWVTLAEQNSQLKFVFAEGPSDARLLEVAFGHSDSTDFKCGEDIHVEDLHTTSFCGGNKARLTSLAMKSAKADLHNNMICLVDSDFRCFCTEIKRPKTLIYTDHSNIISGSINKDWLHNFTFKSYGLRISDEMWLDFVNCLSTAFVAKYISAHDGLNLTSCDLSRYLTKHRSRISFDHIGYIRTYFQTNKTHANECYDRIAEILNWADTDFRNLINSNDMFEYVYKMLRLFSRIGGAVSQESIRTSILGALPVDLGNQASILQIRDWLLQG